MKYTDPRIVAGIILIIGIVALAACIGLGTVKQETSHGLSEIVGGLIGSLAVFSNWVWSIRRDEPPK